MNDDVTDLLRKILTEVREINARGRTPEEIRERQAAALRDQLAADEANQRHDEDDEADRLREEREGVASRNPSTGY